MRVDQKSLQWMDCRECQSDQFVLMLQGWLYTHCWQLWLHGGAVLLCEEGLDSGRLLVRRVQKLERRVDLSTQRVD